MLSDVYAPTIDTTNVETMQYVVTDGKSFTDLQTRDMTYTVSADSTGMTCTVTSRAKSGKYRLTTTYLTDPARDSVVVHTQFTPQGAAGPAAKYHVYVRLDATVGGNGGGGDGNGGADSAVVDVTTGSPVPISYDTVTTTNAANRDYAVPTYLALRADRPFGAVSSGFVGTPSDGLTQLDASHTLAASDTATGGNVEQTAEVSPGRDGEFTLALGFGTTQASAVATAGATVHTAFGQLTADYSGGWASYDKRLRAPSAHLPGLNKSQQAAAIREYYVSANVVKASEDKTFPGAIVASLASPWGQAVSAGDPNNTYFGSYREVFSRDLYEAWTALFTDGDLATARAATRFLLEKQQLPDGSLPRNSLVNGKTRARLVQHPAGRGGLPDPDGAAVRPRGRRHIVAARPGRRQLPDRARALVRPGAMGGAERLLTVDDRRRDRRAGCRGHDRAAARLRRGRPDLVRHGRPVPALHQGLGRNHERSVVESALFHKAFQDR